jgi:uncharacterized membrane protein YvbJ
MKRCPKCHFDNNDDDSQCQKCKYVFKDKTKEMKGIEKNDEEWPSDEWKDWNLM